MKNENQVVIRFSNPALERIDPTTAFFFAPHTVSALLLGGLRCVTRAHTR